MTAGKRDNAPSLEEALTKFDRQFRDADLVDLIEFRRVLRAAGGVRTDVMFELMQPIVDCRIEYTSLQMHRMLNGKRGRPLKSWPDYLMERMAVERVKKRKEEIRRASPSINSIDALDKAISDVAKDVQPRVKKSTLAEWVSHRTRLHRRKRPKRRSGL